MIDQAIDGNSLTLDDEISATVAAIAELEKRLVFSKKFTRLYENQDFQDVIMDTMLGSEMRLKAESLVDPRMTEEQEHETLDVLRLLRYLNKFISGKLLEAQNAETILEQNKKYLLELQVEHEDVIDG